MAKKKNKKKKKAERRSKKEARPSVPPVRPSVPSRIYIYKLPIDRPRGC